MRIGTLVVMTWWATGLGCAKQDRALIAEPVVPATPADELRHRAQGLWAARVARDCPTLFAYRLPTPDSESEREYLEWCKENEPFEIAEFTLRGADVQERWGWVRVAYRARFRRIPDAPLQSVETWEKWVYQDGNWYPVPITALHDYPEAPAMRRLDAESRVRERFVQAWGLRQSRDWAGLYQLVDPLDRDAVPEPEYARAEGLFAYLDHEVHWIEVIGDRGRVRVSYRHKSTDPSLTKLPARSAALTENWIERNGEWYLDLRRE